MNKVLIEESNIDLLELFGKISDEARMEKLSGPPINEMLYWWTRKPLVVGRAISLTSTLNDIEAVKDLMGLGREKRAYTYIPDIEIYKKKLGKEPSEIKVLDPFGGQGNLIFEAKRLGLDCTVSDYNPVAYLLEKAVLEYPAKYGSKLAEEVEKQAKIVIEKTRKEIAQFYGKNDLVYFWVWCVKCPHCGQRVPLTNQMWLANSKHNKIGIRFHITSNKNFKTELIKKMNEKEGRQFTQKGGKAKCINCKDPITYADLTTDIAKRKDRELIAKLIRGKNREYVLATEKDKKLFNIASEYMESKLSEYEKENLIPDEDILPSHRKENMLWLYGIKRWRDYFSKRQLLVMVTLLKNIRSISEEIDDKEYAKVVLLYLSFFLCRHVNSNSYGLVWHVGAEKIAHTLTFRRPSFVFNNVEINPFQKLAGSLENVLNNISDAISFTASNKPCSKINFESVLKLPTDIKYDLIITDPPYLDDVQYGELSEFFYVWLIRSLQEYFTELPKRPKLDEDLCESWGRFGKKQTAFEFFEKGIKRAFVSMNHILKKDGLLIVFFSHSSSKAWNLLLECIRESKFSVVSSYAIHTENTSNPIAIGKTSFMSSVVIACKKITIESTAFFEDIITEVDDEIERMLSEISQDRILSLPITDLIVMVYGKVLEATTQHTILKSYQKDFKPSFEILINNTLDSAMKKIVIKLTGRSINILGAEMSFYLLVKIFSHGILSGDESIKVARTYNLEFEDLEKKGMVVREEGEIRLTYLYESEFNKKSEEINYENLYEQLSFLAHTANTEGASKIISILSQEGKNFRVDDLKQIINLLLKSLRLRLNKEKQLITQELKELKILETLSDVFGIKTTRGSLDSFFDKK